MAKLGPRTTYRHTDQFEATAVRLSQLPGVAVGDVAAEGVRDNWWPTAGGKIVPDTIVVFSALASLSDG